MTYTEQVYPERSDEWVSPADIAKMRAVLKAAREWMVEGAEEDAALIRKDWRAWGYHKDRRSGAEWDLRKAVGGAADVDAE